MVLVHARNGLVPREHLDDGKGDGGGKMWVSRAWAGEQRGELVGCTFVDGEDGGERGEAAVHAGVVVGEVAGVKRGFGRRVDAVDDLEGKLAAVVVEDR